MSDAVVTLVSGVPRSGTSLMMQMLEAAGIEPLVDDSREPDESNPRGYYELDAVKRTRTDSSWVEGATGRAVKVIHALLADLPRDRRYRVIFMSRHLDEVLASQKKMLERLGRPASSVPRDRLAVVFQGQVDQTLRLIEDETCFEWLRVEHSDLLRDPQTEASRVEAFLGLRGVATRMAAEVDPALHRVRTTAQLG